MVDDAPDAPAPDEPTRAATDASLQAAVGRGELGLAEYEDRSAGVWSAGTRAELERLTADLVRPAPGTAAAVTPDAVAPRARTQHTVAVFSESTSGGAVEPGGTVAATAVFGRAAVDLRRTDLPERVDVRAVALFGETEVLVPRGANVRLRGPAVLGSRRADVDAADPGAPVVTITGASVLGSLTVHHGDAPAATPSGAAVAVTADTGSRAPALRRSGRSPWARAAAVVAAAAAAYGLVQVVGADHSSIFGSGTVNVSEPGPVDVGMLFGSYEVVVPDGARVDTGGLVVFGSTSCDAACTPGATGPAISVHATGAFGSVEVVTVTEAARKDAGSDR